MWSLQISQMHAVYCVAHDTNPFHRCFQNFTHDYQKRYALHSTFTNRSNLWAVGGGLYSETVVD